MMRTLQIPRHKQPSVRAILRELPWLLAATWSVALLLAAVPTLNHPWGSNWPMYFEAARYFWDPSAAYFGWRPPLYPLGLATLGNEFGYVRAAHWIAASSMVILIFAAGLIARLSVGVGAAILAVLSIPLLQCAVEGAMWTNMYPPAAASLTVAVAMATALWRRPTIGLAVLAGLAAGLAWRMNHLGLVAVPLGLGMACLGARRRVQLLIVPMAFCLGVGGMVAADQWVVEHWNVPQEGLGEQVIQRRREELDRIGQGGDDVDRFSACTDLEPKPLNLHELTNDCGQQFVAANYGTLTAEDCVPSIPTLMWLLPFALLPSATRRSWRDTGAAVLLFGGPLGAVLIAAAWTSYAEKYILSYLGMMVLLAPMAGDRLGGWLGAAIDRVSLGRVLGLLFAATWIVTIWPGAQGPFADKPNIQRDWESHAGDIAEWAKQNLGPDDLLIDCVPLNVDLVLLPSVANIKEGVSTGHDCRRWVVQPPKTAGQTFLVQQSFPHLIQTQPKSLLKHGWVLVRTLDDSHRLWTR